MCGYARSRAAHKQINLAHAGVNSIKIKQGVTDTEPQEQMADQAVSLVEKPCISSIITGLHRVACSSPGAGYQSVTNMSFDTKVT